MQAATSPDLSDGCLCQVAALQLAVQQQCPGCLPHAVVSQGVAWSRLPAALVEPQDVEAASHHAAIHDCWGPVQFPIHAQQRQSHALNENLLDTTAIQEEASCQHAAKGVAGRFALHLQFTEIGAASQVVAFSNYS